MTTIRDLIRLAYSELGVADYLFDLGPEEDARAKTQLVAMLAEWSANGARIGYSSGDLADSANVPEWAITGIYAGLALRIAPGIGKTPNPETIKAAMNGKATIVAKTSTTIKRYPPGYAGAGSRRFNTVPEPDRLWLGGDDILEIGNGAYQ